MPSDGDVAAHAVVRRVPGGRVVLDQLDARFPAGKITLVHGANGAGKSVLARVLARVDRPDAGRIAGPRRVLLVPERVAAVPGCSARALAAGLAGAVGAGSRGSWPRRFEEALDRLGSSHRGTTPLDRLSKGNLQKAFLAAAYAVQPRAVVLDEPFTGLDETSTGAARELVRTVAREGCAVIVTAHRDDPVGDDHFRLADGGLRPDERGGDLGAEQAASRYLVDVGPPERIDVLLAAPDLARAVADRSQPPPETGTVRLVVTAEHLDDLLRLAVAHDLAVRRVVLVRVRSPDGGPA